ncbi:MAG TPA: L,D-transpeptidase [Chloroflexota bacterium]|nr:L,D-transpeptidase [Chloroflexota bacterium]
MEVTRRAFLRTVPAIAVALALPIPSVPGAAACLTDDASGPAEVCEPGGLVARPAGDPPFQSWWVKTFLATKTWPTPDETVEAVDTVPEGRHFRVEGRQRGYRLPVFDPHMGEHVYIGAEAVGPVDPPFWSAFADDGRWIDVDLAPMQHIRAMQGDEAVFRDLVTAGLQGTTKPGFYRILRRVRNETMDSRTIPGLQDSYYLTNVLYTQYFTGDGAAIHYNWWGPPYGFGYAGSHGCLGMRLDGSKYMWEWASIGTPLVIHN